METLVIQIKNKKDSKLIKELLSRLDVNIEKDKVQKGIIYPKKKMTAQDIKGMSGILKGKLVSKEHLRSISWKKRNW